MLALAAVLMIAAAARAQLPPAPASALSVQGASATAPAHTRFAITVADENGVAVVGARIALTGADHQAFRCETDHAGRCSFSSLPGGSYALQAEKVGFYRLELPQVMAEAASTLELTLVHEQEVRETVDVVESAPAIDPAQTTKQETLTAREVLNVPYPTSRDIRNALPLLPGVVRDMNGNIHVAGSSVTQTLQTLDGFDITDPVGGFLNVRVNADSVRTVNAESSRYSTAYGRGSSVLALNTGMGDDRFRFATSNFLPSFTLKNGFSFSQWVPRATISGPLKRGKIWFFVAPEAEYTLNIVNELPRGADRGTTWLTGNLTRLQMNLTPRNIISAEFVVDNFHRSRSGLSLINPISTTTDVGNATYLGAIKDQHYFQSGALVEIGFATTDFSGHTSPRGDVPYEIHPEFARGSYFLATQGSARRYQGITNLYFPPWNWHGRHELKVGLDSVGLHYHRTYGREPIFIYRYNGATPDKNGSLARKVEFTGRGRVRSSNLQNALYAQDRWSPTERLLLEAGFRLDWDQIVRTPLFGPRFAATYLLNSTADTKLSAGIGWFYGATNLEEISRPFIGERIDSFYDTSGALIGRPVVTTVSALEHGLKAPRFVNTSFSLEHRLPKSVFLRIDLLDRRQKNGFVHQNIPGAQQRPGLGQFVLTNARQDHYDSLQFTLRRTFKGIYPLMASYTWSSARTNTLVDFNLLDPVLASNEIGGRLPWDAPHRLVAWGWFPFIKKIDLGWAAEARTGFPFSVLNQEQQLVGVNTMRFPLYYTVTISGERRFHLFGRYLALRAAIEDVTGHRNPNAVMNNIDSPFFGSFGSESHRVVTGRIRFLGRSQDKSSHRPAAEEKTQPALQP